MQQENFIFKTNHKLAVTVQKKFFFCTALFKLMFKAGYSGSTQSLVYEQLISDVCNKKKLAQAICDYIRENFL